MPTDWSRPQDVERLADSGARHEFDVELAGFPRLRAQLAAGTGRASGHVRVWRVSGRPMAEVVLRAGVPLVCQRCLGRVDVPVESESQVVLLREPAEGDGLPLDAETLFAENGRVSLRDLVEEELLLGLPLVPRHEDAAQCAAELDRVPAPVVGGGESARERDVEVNAPEAAGHATQTPFAGLGELLKRRE